MKRSLVLIFLSLYCSACAERLLAQSTTPPTDESASVETTQKHDAPQPKPRPAKPTVKDSGVFSEFDAKVELSYPPWLDGNAAVATAVVGQDKYVVAQGVAFGMSSDENGHKTNTTPQDDADGDGIPNQIDILMGGKKTIINNASYGSPYRKLDFPNGDVPTTEGVCTDVVIRAVRNAGIDLQQELNKDIKRSPKSFRMVKRPDPNIDQRRVKTLLPYFKRNWTSLPTEFVGRESTWLPGDIVFMQTMGDARPDHIGIVSDKVGISGAPLIINNWTDGYNTDEIDIYPIVGATHRFRYPTKVGLVVDGLEGVLTRNDVKTPEDSKQAILVTASSQSESYGFAQRFHRKDARWKPVGDRVSVRLGSNGLASGIGYSNTATGLEKTEGDGRSPIGVFLLGKAFGKKSFKSKRYPYTQVKDNDVWVDDPKSTDYNRWVERGTSKYESAESLTDYDYAVVVEHNFGDPKPGAGSAIFLHSWSNARSTAGCTGFEKRTFVSWLKWLDDGKNPILIQVPDSFY